MLTVLLLLFLLGVLLLTTAAACRRRRVALFAVYLCGAVYGTTLLTVLTGAFRA